MGKIVLMENMALNGVAHAPGDDQGDPEGSAHGSGAQPSVGQAS